MATHIENINNHDGGVINIHNPKHKVPTQLTSKLGKDTIIGRETELKEIDELLNSSNSLLLINGIGGIGKSTIASYYLHSQKDKLDYYGFFEGVDSFLIELRSRLDIKAEKEQEAFMEALTKLSALKGNKLLVIDDVKNIEENQDKIEKILALENSGYKILLTSREEIEDVEQYYLDVLSIDDAKKLFNSIYEVKNEVLLEEILEYLDCHAFFVEMTAKTLKSKKTLTSKLIKEKFESGEFSTIKRKRKESFNDYLNKLFSFDELDDEEILMLKQLSVLPSIEIEFNILKIIFKNDEELEELLNDLNEKGWISYSNGTYKLHQIVKEYIFLEHSPSFKEIEFIVIIWSNIELEAMGHNREFLVFLESMAKALDKIEDKKIQLEINFFYHFGRISHFLGEYNSAEISFQRVIDILSKINGEEHFSIIEPSIKLANVYVARGVYDKLETLYFQLLKISEKEEVVQDISVARLYEGLGRFYKLKGLYREAEEFLIKALNLKKKLLSSDDHALESVYSSLGFLYMLTGNHDKSEPFFLKSLNITKKAFGKEHSETAVTYNNIGLFYFEIKEYKKSESYYLEALKIYQRVFKENNGLIATLYNNFGLLYMQIKDYEKSERFFLDSLSLREDLLDDEHFYIAQSYNHLSSLYIKLGEYKKAFYYVEKALKIRSKILPYTHPDLINSKKIFREVQKNL